jgi:predicted dehydrogenase
MLRVGFVGFGGIAQGAHTPAWKKLSSAAVVAVCDINPEKLEKAKSVFSPDIKCYTSYEEMIDNEKLDIVDVCTPNYLHSPVACYGLNHGAHVLCEKPDSICVEDVVKMQEAEKASGKRLMVIRNNRYTQGSQYLKHIVASGEAGDIYAGRCGWVRKRGIPGKGGWFTTKELSGGGPLIDLGVHMIDLAIYLMGNPKAVSVSGSTYSKFADSGDKADSVHASFGEAKADGVYDVEDLAIGFIKFDNGASLQIEFSWASNIKKEGTFVELRGTKKGLEWKSGLINIYDEKKNTKLDQIKYNAKAKKFDSGIAHTLHGHEANISHFVDVITKDTEPVYKIEQGVNMIKILTGIYKSAETGREVVL